MRIGMGYDVHRLEAGRKLILGGVEIPFEKGLLGHSDADVLTHAIGDAILGAAALGDLGRHFPDTDPQYKDISSLLILEKIVQLIEQKGFRVGNIDSVIIAEKPKMLPFIQQMRENVAMVTRITVEQVSIKATTTEKLGFTGTGAGIAAQAVVLLNKLE